MKQTADLRKVGLKVTLPRLKILEILESAGDRHHLTAEDIYRVLIEQNEEVGLATVYRVLTQFESAGIVRRLNFENNISTFELDTGDNHDHIVCLSSGFVEEFVDPIIEDRIKVIAQEKGYDLSWHRLTIYGTKQREL
jgi:Fur family ferric uptake transcriptional regulator